MQNGSVLWIALAALLVSSAGAASQEPRASAPKKKRPDASDLICERVTVVGSRLSVKKVCMTRLEWEEKKTLDREFIDRVQFPMGGLRDGT
jgi:hypothetical protein